VDYVLQECDSEAHVSFICEACFHSRAPDVRLVSNPGGYVCERCLLAGARQVHDGAALTSGPCVLCLREGPGALLGPESEHRLCPQCSGFLPKLIARLQSVRDAT
jgi:hypothetical protein